MKSITIDFNKAKPEASEHVWKGEEVSWNKDITQNGYYYNSAGDWLALEAYD